MQNKKMTYEQAIDRLEQLAQQMEQGEVPIDEMVTRLREAQTLIKQCRQQLTKADEQVRQILDAPST
ncbi:MAG: exodeoxyribonuclease VII small subunit [Bacteroidaceae bacterium]|jgi:exodeoxyribonuclease VII small subunit|nr:exodeoxyribonuclease VII small subunit [Bacteroidaceae bacterium]